MTTSKKKTKKVNIIEQLEAERASKVIVYFTGDKFPPQQFATQIASDVIPLFRNILENFGQGTNKVSLVLNTNGGHLETPWPLVNLIREYCKYFEVIVVEKALSAGTMISLGADKIVMLPYSQLSPIDPAADIMDGEKKQVKRLEIEDIIGYIDFAKEKIGIAEQSSLCEIMKELTKEISPTMLGSINRTHALIRRLSKNLLDLHRQRLTDKQIREITENLTQKLYSHKHLINRKEAKDLVGFGSIIEYAKPKTKKIIDDIYKHYTDLLEIQKEFNPLKILGSDQEKSYSLIRAIVHSNDIKYDFNSSYQILKVPDPSGKQQIAVNNINNQWLLNK
jgi:ATP-dependent protease ClpP protease subunit